jgi:murein DD-endopeptidase MepM/ murein hydrolase activator NlpD
MNLIFFSRREGRARHLNLSHPVTLGLTVVGVVGLLGGVFMLGQHYATDPSVLASNVFTQQRAEIASLKEQLQDRVDALAMRLGQLDAHLIRLNALGKRLTQMANINSQEFDFDHDPPRGGPESDSATRGARMPELENGIEALDAHLDLRSSQFDALQNVILGRELSAEIRPSGRPVVDGYISSYFGERMDPFNGEEAFHKGVDFASGTGADVQAVASGVVVWAGPREGYGNLVEINHGNGYTTRYAHDSKIYVAVGDTVQRGQSIAQVGSTGRSTGPHVHFEVLKDGRQIDPMSFVEH